MLQLHLIKATQAIPFVRVLEEAGAPVRKISERVGMPIDAVYAGKGVIGEYCVWRFIDLAAKHERLDLFGYDVANQYPVNSVEGLGGIRTRTATTLKELLEYFIEDVQVESTGCPYSLVPNPSGIWFVRELMFGDKRKNWQTEQYMIAIIIQIIRLCTGPRWLPSEIKISSSNKALPIPEEWKSIKLVWGSEATEIMIPERVLPLPLTKQSTQKISGSDETPDPATRTPLEITELVRTQILTNTIGLENAAQQTGLSPKTLKRKLLQDNTSYSEIVDQLRFELAQSKLKNVGIPIHAIARELGYEHQANFTRAFKRMCGITPQEYRNRLGL
ncbi:MAG: helix-turn-helix transcriptional regulator [Gammaproteobacteria bacterium]|nr:helix-turn-helix transcriptional regulator [Gammaproteobacteria bacterium]